MAASFEERTELVRKATTLLLGGGMMGRVVEVQKGRKAVAGLLKALVAGVQVRRPGCSVEASWQVLDELVCGYLAEGKEAVEGVVEACEVLVGVVAGAGLVGVGGTGETKKLIEKFLMRIYQLIWKIVRLYHIPSTQ